MSTEQQEKSIIECIRDFIKKCHHLPDYYKSIGVDYLDSGVASYMIEAVPCKPVVKWYVNGTSIRQYAFHFSSREAYSADIIEQLENSRFYENFAGWLENCSNAGDLPELTGGKVARSITATTPGYLYDAEQGTGQYVIQCNLIYFCP